MKKFSADTFIHDAIHDSEQCQYYSMEFLKSCREELSHNRLYPVLSDLIELAKGLDNFLDRTQSFHSQLPQRIKSIDMESKEIIFESQFTEHPDLVRIEEIVRLMLPEFKLLIDEGVSIYDFVDENVSVAGVGILPMYKDEGYCIIPEHSAALIHFVYYQLSLYTSGEEKYRLLKTNVVESVEEPKLYPTAITLKHQLISHHQELPNPATFVCETDLDFPLQETILPIVKRKLMANLVQGTIH
jgi:hypothetical protein